jgi:exonuclease VII large subunit
MVKRLEGRTERKMQYMNSRLKALSTAQNAQDNGLTIDQLEQSLGAMEGRLEDRLNRKIQTVNERLKEISKSDTAGHAHRASIENLEKRVARIESRLETIAEAVGNTVESNPGDDDADRKRLKEKLKEALESEERDHASYDHEKESWMEYIFGICKADGRMGKRGSRYAQA